MSSLRGWGVNWPRIPSTRALESLSVAPETLGPPSAVEKAETPIDRVRLDKLTWTDLLPSVESAASNE